MCMAVAQRRLLYILPVAAESLIRSNGIRRGAPAADEISCRVRSAQFEDSTTEKELNQGTSTKRTMDPQGGASNSCNSWPLYALYAR